MFYIRPSRAHWTDISVLVNHNKVALLRVDKNTILRNIPLELLVKVSNVTVKSIIYK